MKRKKCNCGCGEDLLEENKSGYRLGHKTNPKVITADELAAKRRMRELERSLAYELCCAVIDTDLRTDEEPPDHRPEDLCAREWYDENSDIRTDELIPEVMEYLTLRGLIERDPERVGFFAIRDESEGVA